MGNPDRSALHPFYVSRLQFGAAFAGCQLRIKKARLGHNFTPDIEIEGNGWSIQLPAERYLKSENLTTDPWSLGQWLVLATFKHLPTEQVQPDKAALLSAGPVPVRVTLKSKLARLLSIYPILKPKIQAWTLYKDHKFLHQFVKFCRKGCFCIFGLNIFPQFYALVYKFFRNRHLRISPPIYV